MEKKILEIKENQIIQINESVLTPEVIKTIEFFQRDENDLVKSFREYVSDAICQLLQAADNNSGLEKEETTRTITNLAYCRDYLKGLEKPITIEHQPINQ
jgi:hypothetical protein